MKPAYWIVFVSGKESARFETRKSAKLYAMGQRIAGHDVIIKTIGA